MAGRGAEENDDHQTRYWNTARTRHFGYGNRMRYRYRHRGTCRRGCGWRNCNLLGAATGHPLVGAAVGAGTGALVGGAVGNNMDAQKQQAQARHNRLRPARRWGLAAGVIDMTRKGIDEGIIINQIRNTRSTFMLSNGDIDLLQQNRVSPNVIMEMQHRPPVVYRRPPPYYYAPPPPVAIGFGYR